MPALNSEWFEEEYTTLTQNETEYYAFNAGYDRFFTYAFDLLFSLYTNWVEHVCQPNEHVEYFIKNDLLYTEYEIFQEPADTIDGFSEYSLYSLYRDRLEEFNG